MQVGQTWRLGRPGARPGPDEDIADWVQRSRAARRRVRRVFVAAVTVVALVIGAGVGISVIEGSDAHAARAHAFDREVKQLEQFVAHARHLDFIRPVHVEMLRSDQYDIRRGNDFASTRAYLVPLASFRSVGSPTATSTSATGTKTRVGELITRLFLAPVLGTDRATAAAATWNGDLAMTWHDGAKSCIGIVYANPAVGHDEPLLDALRAWARATPGATFTRAQLTACA